MFYPAFRVDPTLIGSTLRAESGVLAAAGPVFEPATARVVASAAPAGAGAAAATARDVAPGHRPVTPTDAGRAVAPAAARSAELQAPTGSGTAAGSDAPEPTLATSIVEVPVVHPAG